MVPADAVLVFEKGKVGTSGIMGCVGGGELRIVDGSIEEVALKPCHHDVD